MKKKGTKIKKQNQGLLFGIKMTSEEQKHTGCPAQCKRTGKCHGISFFKGEPGKSRACIGKRCKYLKKFKTRNAFYVGF